jgi:hypothetical protein
MPGSCREQASAFPGAQKRIARKNHVDDFFGVLFAVIESDLGLLNQVR